MSNEVGGTYQEAFLIVLFVIVRRRKPRTFNSTDNPAGIEQVTVGNAVHNKQLRSVDVVGHERRVG